MKAIFYACIFLFSINLSSQTETRIWGMTSSGGNRYGVIFSTDSSGNNLQTEYLFGANPMRQPTYTHFCEWTNGKLYGMTMRGGATEYSGVLFSYDPNSNSWEKHIDFIGPNGAYPEGSLVLASNGKMYGMTRSGGANNDGTLFEFDPATSVLTTLVHFEWTTIGDEPYGSLLEASNGKLYGMTSSGGIYNGGTLFKFDPVTSDFTVLYEFDWSTNGHNPCGTLVEAPSGEFYGMTKSGGILNRGTLFKFDPDSNIYTVEVLFNDTIGCMPEAGSLTFADNGLIYGVLSKGGLYNYGTLFEFNPDSSTFTKIIDFDNNIYGGLPCATLVEGSGGKLYGMAQQGGTTIYGVLFEFDPSTHAFDVKSNFMGSSTGGFPLGSLTMASNGKFYGLSYGGGVNGEGTVYEYDPVAGTLEKKIDFGGDESGRTPHGSLVMTHLGKFYGMTFEGDYNDKGNICAFDPQSSTYTVKFEFANNSSPILYEPYGSLVSGSIGMLYGMTSNGGAYGHGAIFKYDINAPLFEIKISFIDSIHGSTPYGDLMKASNGKLYGMTMEGGTNNGGTLFEYDFTNNSFQVIHQFNWSDGGRPYGSLLQANDGKLYGVTSCGGANNNGVLFTYDLSLHSYSVLYDFIDTLTGSGPTGTLVQANNGLLYGLTSSGGANSGGVLFEFDPVFNTCINKFSFDYILDSLNGSLPKGSLLLASNCKLYGLTNRGGTFNMGVMFEFDPNTGVYTKKTDFNGTNGRFPTYTKLVETTFSTGINEESLPSIMFKTNPNPAFEEIIISTEIIDDYTLSLFNENGECVYYSYFPNTNSIKIAIHEYSSGIYFLSLSNNNTKSTKKIIIKH